MGEGNTAAGAVYWVLTVLQSKKNHSRE